MSVKEIESAFVQASKTLRASLRPVPSQTGDGSYIEEVSSGTGILNDLGKVNLSDVETMIDLTKNAASRHPVDDKTYLMERVIQAS
jgi:linoleate 8R-lipoxygenase/9,12-octadecadienoate 8-hydroperoxide 8R-isomerase